MPSPYHMHTTLLAEFADDRDIGSREMQEDYTLCCAVEEQGNYCSEMMCVLCDGMGGACRRRGRFSCGSQCLYQGIARRVA